MKKHSSRKLLSDSEEPPHKLGRTLRSTTRIRKKEIIQYLPKEDSPEKSVEDTTIKNKDVQPEANGSTTSSGIRPTIPPWVSGYLKADRTTQTTPFEMDSDSNMEQVVQEPNEETHEYEVRQPEVMHEYEVRQPEVMQENVVKQPEVLQEYGVRQPEVIQEYEVRQPEVLQEYEVRQPEVLQEYGVRQPEVIQEYEVRQPEVIQEYGVRQPEMIQEYGVRQPEVIQVYEIRQPEVMQEYVVRQPEVIQEYGVRQPEVIQEYVVRQPEVIQEYGVRQPELIQEYEVRQPEVMQEFVFRQPEVIQEYVFRQPEVIQEYAVIQPEVIQEYGVRQPEVIQEYEVRQPEVIQEHGVRQPEVIQEYEVRQPEVIQEYEVRQPEVIQEYGVRQPEVIQESGARKPEVIQEYGARQPEVIQESGVRQPEVIQESGVRQPEVIQESGVRQPEVIQESGVRQPEVIQESGVRQPEVIQESGVRQPDMIQESEVRQPEVTQDYVVQASGEVITVLLQDSNDELHEFEISAVPQELYLIPAHIQENLNEEQLTYLTNEDKHSDRLMHSLLPPHCLTYDWSCDQNVFTAAKETFSGPAGPTFQVTKDHRPVDIFLKFFDTDLLDFIVTQTNKHAARIKEQGVKEFSRVHCYRDVHRSEVATFLSVVIFQSLLPIPMEIDYWKENGYLTLKYFSKIMLYNRFILVKRMLYFTDKTVCDNDKSDRAQLQMVWPVLDHLRKKFRSLYMPGRNIAIDDSLLKWQTRQSFTQKLTSRASKDGAKSYEVCECDTGYLWDFRVYPGDCSQDVDVLPRPDPDDTADKSVPSNASTSIVYHLAKPLFKRGHSLVMDSFYTSPLLARFLKYQGTDCFGTLRVDREFYPETIKVVSKCEVRPGEILQTYCPDLYVMLWRADNTLVSLLSTFHSDTVVGVNSTRPPVVVDYNNSMGGLDKKDQILAAYPERTYTMPLHKKLFKRLLNVTLLNAYIIYKTQHKNVTHRWFRAEVASQLLKAFKPSEIEAPFRVQPSSYAIGPKKDTTRPILVGNHYVGSGPSKNMVCVWCKKCRTAYICKQCKISLCLHLCFEEYHTSPKLPKIHQEKQAKKKK